LSKERNT